MRILTIATLVALQLAAAPPKALVVTKPTIQTTTEKAQKALKVVTKGFDEEAAKQLLNALYAEGIQSIKAELEGRSLFPDTANPVMDYLSHMVSLETLQNQTDLHRALSKAYRVFVELTWYQAWNKGEETADIPVFPTTKDKAIKCSEDMIEILAKRHNAPEAEFEYRQAQEAAKLLTPSESTWAKFLDSGAKAVSGVAALNFEEVWEGLKSINTEIDKEGVEEWYFNTFFMRWVFVNVRTPKDLKSPMIQAVVKNSVKKCMEEGREYAQGLLMCLMDILENPDADPKLKEIAILGSADLPGIISLFEKDDVSAIVTFCNKMGMDLFAQKFDRFQDARLLAQSFLKKIATDPKFSAYKGKSCAALCSRSIWLQKQHQRRLEEERLKVQASLNAVKTQMDQLALTERAVVGDLLAKVSHPDGNYVIPPECTPPEQKKIEEEMAEINQKLSKIFNQQTVVKLAAAEQKRLLDLFEQLAAAVEKLDKEEIRILEETLKELSSD